MRSFRALLAALVAAGALAFSVPAPVRALQATGCAKTYTVKPNDSWNRISTKVKVSMALLLQVNKAKSTSMLLIGDVICLPKAAVTESAVGPEMKLKPTKIYSVAKSTAIIREVFPDSLETRAIAIAKRESQLNAANYNGKCCIGLFQIYWKVHRSWLKNIGITDPNQLLDAPTNARAAYALYKRSNSWSAWG